MRQRLAFLFLGTIFSALGTTMSASGNFIPANNPRIQYFGRWDMIDSLHPRYSWPGVYIEVEFTGTSIGVRLKDGTNYFNVTIDGALHGVFHGTSREETDYLLADSLPNTRHTLLLTRRNITFEPPYTFSGFLLDSGATLLPPPPKPARKIEFIGDSFTAAESDEAHAPHLEWEARFPVTNIDKGFAPLIARHFNAQYTTTCRSGGGLYCDWQGKTSETIPDRFNRTLMEAPTPTWDFKQWIPDVVIICLGLNDRSGLRGKGDSIPDSSSALFRETYHKFLATIREVYPGVKIVAVAAYPEWTRKNVKQVVDEELGAGKQDVHYATFSEYPGGYVADGHPTVATHAKMADELIQSIESFHLFQEAK